ncbi:uncharacterized protein BYT42DRAFT_634697 [Radiomyces spectabilis]|uniref:uncharacterized protein n=1 Tax=Radiomyces spectabilis TaxID=64574 RepID=UPI00221F5DF9|nr:uncharacterized protein BYT42DRAFT_634697 [Radiomyces spectabilis]KAI8381451.1 hypothetical protein BYT42DRAFT_634697 [Radiomyces spectabilis]
MSFASSRALAVASYQDRFDIFILNQRASRTSFDPFVGMGSVTEEGILWHMEFLHTEHATPDRIVLCTVVYNDIERLCRVIVYIIDASNPDDVIVRRIGRLPLERNTPLPVLLIPLAFKPETMLLVTEQYISVFNTDDVASGNVHYPTSLIPRPFGELDCKFRGQMFRVDLSDLDDISWEWFAGSNPIGQAMCALGTIQMMDDDNVIPADVLFYVGESADSQVIAVGCSTTRDFSTPFPEPIIMQTMTNRAPLSNATIAPSMEGAQDALIACSGQHGGGSLSFITNGISADLIEPFDSGCRG